MNFLLVGEGPYIYLVSFDIPNEHIPLPIPINTTGTVDYITYDRSHHLVYWTQRDPPAIWRSMLDGEGQEAFITESISLPQGIVISDEGTNLYWADSALDKIEVVSLYEDAFHRRTLIDTGLDHPIGLAINESIGLVIRRQLLGLGTCSCMFITLWSCIDRPIPLQGRGSVWTNDLT